MYHCPPTPQDIKKNELNVFAFFCIMQIYILLAPASKFTMGLFRVMIHTLQGAMIALLFPVVNTRLVSIILHPNT